MSTGGNLFTATTSYLASGSATTLRKVEDIQALLGRLDALVSESEGYWRGTAAGQFHTLMSEYHVDSARLNQSLSAIGYALQTSGANIGGAEEMNVSNINTIQLPQARLT